ncbi:peroxisomal membrane protein PMP34 isoform X5 [Engystomops pustulosus]|uniref:peroxisomal membrane protein PMP34 isoform X5 n=1 Tax=Engystomops pustulosus TaxID=76066 RepID=UPI003AFB29D7
MEEEGDNYISSAADLKSAMSSILTYENLVHAVSGAVGSMTAMSVFYPLDTARLRLQVDENRKSRSTPAVLMEIIKEEGLLAPYRGWFPVIASLCCSNFVFFYTFNSLKTLWLKATPPTTSKDLSIGFIAGIVNVLFTTPLWVVNTRLKLQGAKFRNDDIKPTTYTGISDAFQKILQHEGILALWNGTLPSLLLVFNPAIQFMFYEALKRQVLKQQTEETHLRGQRILALKRPWMGVVGSDLKSTSALSSIQVFLIGAIAKAIATTVTYPLQTVQSILRFGHEKTNSEKRTFGCFSVFHLTKQRISHNFTDVCILEKIVAIIEK